MNYISPILSFVGEPFVSSYQLVRTATPKLLKSNSTPDFKAIREGIESAEKDIVLIPDHIKEKIVRFITDELKVDASRMVFVYRDKGDFATKYSQKYDGLAYLLIPRLEAAEIKTELLNRHKFSIAHEVGHIVADDNYSRDIIDIKSFLMRTLAYSVSSTMLSALFSNSYTAMIGGHLLSCAAAKTMGFMYKHWAIRQQEILADGYAMNISPEIALGGVEGFMRDQYINRELRDDVLRFIVKEIRDAEGISSMPRKCYLIACFALGLMSVSDEGELRDDFEHPALAERIKLIQDHLKLRASRL
jgi:Peptidase family M48